MTDHKTERQAYKSKEYEPICHHPASPIGNIQDVRKPNHTNIHDNQRYEKIIENILPIGIIKKKLYTKTIHYVWKNSISLK